MYDYLCALVILTGQADVNLTQEQFSRLAPLIRTILIEEEVMDVKQRWMLTQNECFTEDLRILRHWRNELRDAPPAMDYMRFGYETGTINELLNFNRAYHQNIEPLAYSAGPRREEYLETVQETDRLYAIWDALRDAQNQNFYISCRRQKLKDLRFLIGKDDYAATRMPVHVPVHRFKEIDSTTPIK